MKYIVLAALGAAVTGFLLGWVIVAAGSTASAERRQRA